MGVAQKSRIKTTVKFFVIAITFFANLLIFDVALANECRVLVVVGMKDERDIVTGKSQNPSIQVVVGTANADTLRNRLQQVDPASVSAVFSFGVAGALNPALAPGDLLFSEQAFSQVSNNKQGHTEINWAIDSHLLMAASLNASKAQLKFRKGIFLGADTEARDQVLDIVTRLHEVTGADIIDNETHIAAQFANEHGLPFLAIRAVSDSVHKPLPPAALLPLDAEDGSADGIAIAKSLLLNPLQLPSLIRAAFHYRKALTSLRIFRDEIGFEKLVLSHGNACSKKTL